MESNKPKNKAGVAVTVIILLLGWIAWKSASMPFIPSEAFINLLVWAVAPLIYLAFIYVSFFLKDKTTGQTSYQRKILTYDTKLKRLLWHLLVPTAVMPAMALGCAFLIQFYPAWPTKYFATQDSILTARLDKVQFKRKVGRPNLYLTDTTSLKEFNILWERDYEGQFQSNELVILHTKYNWFGHYVLDITTEPSS